MRYRVAGLLAVLVTLVLVAASPAAAAKRYVGLGDSDAAGPVIPLQIAPIG